MKISIWKRIKQFIFGENLIATEKYDIPSQSAEYKIGIDLENRSIGCRKPCMHICDYGWLCKLTNKPCIQGGFHIKDGFAGYYWWKECIIYQGLLKDNENL